MSTKFKELLDQEHQWPVEYVFKFIAPTDSTSQLTVVLTEVFERHQSLQITLSNPQNWLSSKPSRNGNFHSLTVRLIMPSSDAVIEVYQLMATMPGIISL